jgi:hypothetical protein
MDFTLPALSQQSFSRWYNKLIPRTDDVEERIVYPGIKLTCSTKSRDLRSQITPAHIFITYEAGKNIFNHKVLGSNDAFAPLPKRLYSHCFHNINIHSIPPNNRITVRLTETTSVILPYIPDDFVSQKRSKRGTMVRKTRGTMKKIKNDQAASRQLQYSGKKRKYVGWVTTVLSAETDTAADDGIDGYRLKEYIREQIAVYENSVLTVVPNPFSNCKTIVDIENDPEKKAALNTVLHFIFHYQRNSFS